MATFPVGVLFVEPYYKPLDYFGKPMPFSTLVFLRSGSAGPIQAPATVYQDGALATPYAQPITADANGRFSPIYLTPGIAYRVKLFDSNGRLMQDVDVYIAQPPFFSQSIVKPNDTVQSSNITPVTDPDLRVFLPYPGVYRFDFTLGFSIVSVGANPNLRMNVDFELGQLNNAPPTGQPNQYVIIANVTGTTGIGNIAADSVVPSSFTPTSFNLQNQDPTFNFFWLRGYVNCQTPGFLGLPWAQNNSNAATLTLRKGSTVTVRQVL